jgi:hypothetical protein
MTTPVDMLELLVSAAAGEDGSVSEVIRPAAIIPEESARTILMELALRDVRAGGAWLTEPNLWQRFDNDQQSLIGTIQVAYGTPTRYEITVFRATVTRHGTEQGWTVASLCDDALQYGDLTLADCPRAQLNAPPKPFRFNTSPTPR